MPSNIDSKIKKTEGSFPARPTGAVERCPLREDSEEEAPLLPIDAKTSFELTADVAKTIMPVAGEKPKEKKAWIEIILVDMEGKPVPGVRYKITPPGGGAPQEGTLNEHGQAGYYQIEPGECKITFPDLDQDAWD